MNTSTSKSCVYLLSPKPASTPNRSGGCSWWKAAVLVGSVVAVFFLALRGMPHSSSTSFLENGNCEYGYCPVDVAENVASVQLRELPEITVLHRFGLDDEELGKRIQQAVSIRPVGKGINEPVFLTDAKDQVLAILKPEIYGRFSAGDFAVRLLDPENVFSAPRCIGANLRSQTAPFLNIDLQPLQTASGTITEYIPHDTLHFTERRALPKEIAKTIPPSQVQRIALLDLLLENRDRHGNNLLVQNQQLIPIDHDTILNKGFDPSDWLVTDFIASMAENGWHANLSDIVRGAMSLQGDFIWLTDPILSAHLSTPTDPKLRLWIEHLNVLEQLNPLLQHPKFNQKKLFVAQLRQEVLKAASRANLPVMTVVNYFIDSGPNDTLEALQRTRGSMQSVSHLPNPQKAAREFFFGHFKQILDVRFSK